MDWNESYGEASEEIQGHDLIKQTPDVATLAQRYITAASEIGRRMPIPNKEASAEAWGEFYGKLKDQVPGLVRLKPDDPEAMSGLYDAMGRPASPEGYALPELTPDQIANGVAFDADRFNALRPVAHALGITKDQLSKLMARDAEFLNGSGVKTQENRLKVVQNLQTELGASFNRSMMLADLAARQFGIDPKTNAAFDDPNVIKAFAQMGEVFGEDPATDLAAAGGGATPTPDQAQREYDATMQNAEHPFHNRRDPGHSAALARMTHLKWWAMGNKGVPPSDPLRG